MIRIGPDPFEGLERAGKEPTTSADEFHGRSGYDSDFLSGWQLPLPQPSEDVRELRRGGPGIELKYQNFSVIMSASRRLPIITAANIDGSQSRRVPRISTWSFDGRLDKEDQWGDALYDSNALDRGHMVRREDPVWGSPAQANTANADTFHFTNSCPQMAGVNQKVWLGLEDYVLQHARVDRMRVSVFTGPFFGKNDLAYRGALVPKAFWKVVAIVTEDGRPSATAYKVDQVKELEELEFVYSAYKTFQISIKQVMKATKVDFSGLVPFDGFSQHENATGTELIEQLDSLENVRI
jgi:endonuclease G